MKMGLKKFWFKDSIGGVLAISSTSDFKHDGITLTVEGTVNLQISSKNVGILEAFYNSVKVSLFTF